MQTDLPSPPRPPGGGQVALACTHIRWLLHSTPGPSKQPCSSSLLLPSHPRGVCIHPPSLKRASFEEIGRGPQLRICSPSLPSIHIQTSSSLLRHVPHQHSPKHTTPSRTKTHIYILSPASLIRPCGSISTIPPIFIPLLSLIPSRDRVGVCISIDKPLRCFFVSTFPFRQPFNRGLVKKAPLRPARS